MRYLNIEEIQVKSFKFHSYGGTNNLGKKLINVKCVDCGYIKEVRKDKFLCGSISKCVCKEFTLENKRNLGWVLADILWEKERAKQHAKNQAKTEPKTAEKE